MLSKHTQRELSTAQGLSTHGRPHLTDPRGEWPQGSLGWFVLFWFVTSLSSGVTLAAEKESLSAMPIHNEMHLKEKSKAKEGQGKESYKSTKRLPFLKISGRGKKKMGQTRPSISTQKWSKIYEPFSPLSDCSLHHPDMGPVCPCLSGSSQPTGRQANTPPTNTSCFFHA